MFIISLVGVMSAMLVMSMQMNIKSQSFLYKEKIYRSSNLIQVSAQKQFFNQLVPTNQNNLNQKKLPADQSTISPQLDD